MLPHFLQNEYATAVAYWLLRGELQAHAFRKRHQGRANDTQYVTIGPPRATPQRTEAELRDAGIVGLYSVRRDASDE
jgi:hypothetical protein